MTRRVTFAALVALGWLALWPATAQAQSAITGTVKDASGAVLPGVTVEASSDALIEKSKAVVSDGEGVYRIVDLRPGTYVVTFQLEGFTTIRREGLELPSEFTMTINADLKVGALEESITVSGSTPVVDISSTVHTQVLGRDTLDSLPTGRTIQGLGQLVVGVALSIPDVGGTRAMQQTYMSTHGMTAANNTVLVDGLMVNGLQADGAVQSYFNDAMSQEVSYQTSGISAETSSGGVRLNMIPREGGNKFAGAFFSSYRDGDWQADNFSQDLKDRGLPNASAIDRIYDLNFSIGGPIKQDKLWFFTSARQWSVNAPIAGTFVTDGSGPAIASCLQAARTSTPCEQGIDDQKIRSALVRMTWQASPRNKIAAYFDEIDKFRGHAMFAGDDYNTAAVEWNSPAYHTAAAKWSSPLSSRLFVEAGYSNNTEDYTNESLDGVSQVRFSQPWYAGAARRDLDLVSTSKQPLISNISTQSPLRYNLQGAVSYVTGSHNMKFGAQRTFGHFGHTRDGNADLDQQYRSNSTGIPFTVPNSVVIYNTPYASREELMYDVGVFAQDQWALKRLTINAGLRWEWVNARVPEQTAPAGRFVSARTFAEIPNVPKQSDPAPRFGVAYDLFGNGKTAIKYSINRYNASRTTGDAQSGAQRYNPLSSDTRELAWTDLNGDDIAQGDPGCAYRTAGCEINYYSATGAYVLNGFGSNRVLTRQDPDISRTWNLEQGIEIQHELFPRTSITLGYFHGAFHNLLFSDNLNVGLADWNAVQVFNPMDGSPMTIYDITATAKGRARDILDSSSNDRTRKFDSVGFNFNTRLPHNATVFGGFGFDRLLESACDEPDNPNLLVFCDETNLDTGLPAGDGRSGYRIPFQFSGKLSGSVELWYGVQLSGGFQSNAGYPNRSLTTTRTGIDGRNTGGTSWLLSSATTYPTVNGVPYCPGCPNGVAPWAANQRVLPTLQGTDSASSLTVRLKPYGGEGEYTDRINQLDLKVSKTFAVGRVRVLPALELFNVFNSNPVILMRSTQYNAPTVLNGAIQPTTYNQPSGILNGRIIGVGAQVRW
jgi:Carboxypeptidase regulatory-like domain